MSFVRSSVLLWTLLASFSCVTDAHADLIGTQVTFGTLYQQSPNSSPVIVSTTASETVTPGVVTFPSLAAYGVTNHLGLYLVNAAVDVTGDGLTETFQNAGYGSFAGAYENDAVFTFSSAALVEITGAVIDPASNLGLTNADLTFSGGELFINYGGGESFNPDSLLKIDLVVQGGPGGGTSVPEPSTLVILATALAGLVMVRQWNEKSRAFARG